MKYLSFIFFCLINLLVTPSIVALPTAPNYANTEIANAPPSKELTKKQIKKQEKRAKRLAKWEAIAQKNLKAVDIDIDLEDPVRKWLWFGLFGLAISVALSLIAFLLNAPIFSRLSYLVGVAGVACLIVWLIKYLN